MAAAGGAARGGGARPKVAQRAGATQSGGGDAEVAQRAAQRWQGRRPEARKTAGGAGRIFGSLAALKSLGLAFGVAGAGSARDAEVLYLPPFVAGGGTARDKRPPFYRGSFHHPR